MAFAVSRGSAKQVAGAVFEELLRGPARTGARRCKLRVASAIAGGDFSGKLAGHSCAFSSKASSPGQETLKDFRDKEFDLCKMASQLNKEKTRQDAVNAEQAATADNLKRREAVVYLREVSVTKRELAGGHVKVDLFFVVKGVEVKVAQLNVDKDDYEILKSASKVVDEEPTVTCKGCIVEELVHIGLDKDDVLKILRDAIERTAAHQKGEKSGSDNKKGDSSSSSRSEGFFEWIWSFLKAASGKKTDQSTLIWLIGLLFSTVDWHQMVLFAAILIEAGIVVNWDLLLNMFDVYMETKLEHSQAMYDTAIERMAAAKKVQDGPPNAST